MHRDDAANFAIRRDFLEDDVAPALAIYEKPESLQGLIASAPETTGNSGMGQFEGADRCRLAKSLWESLKV